MSEVKVNTVSERTAANGVTVDGLSIKDAKLVTADSVITANITDDAVTLAKMASGTDGNIISYDASGNPVAVATGSDGQVLTSAGAGAPPAFETPASAANTPYFAASAASQSSLADNTSFKMNFTSEVVDSDGKYDAPNAKFTPTVAGWYWCYTRILFYNATDEMRSQSNLAFYKNGSLWGNNNSNEYRNGGGLFYFVAPTKSELIYLDADDYLEVYGRPNSVNGETATDGSGCFFSAFRLI